MIQRRSFVLRDSPRLGQGGVDRSTRRKSERVRRESRPKEGPGAWLTEDR